MAALFEEFTLCGLQAAGVDGDRRDKLQGIEGAGEEDRVLVTEAERTVTLYKVSDQKPLGSWAVKQGQRVTCPAIYNYETGQYVVVHDNKVIRVWKDEDVNFDKVFKSTVSADVYRIHSCPSATPLVLFCRGAVRNLDILLADPQQEIENVLSEEETIRWSKMFVEDDQPILLIITVKNSDVIVNMWRPDGASYRAKLQPISKDSRVLDFSASLRGTFVSLTILYSTGDVCQCQVPLSQSEATEAETVLSVSSVLHLPEASETGALVILDDFHIATLTSSSEKQKDCLCIWNTSFQTMQECKEFSQKTWAQLWNYDGNLFLPRGNSLQVLHYICEPSCLASALGKANPSQKSDPVPVVNWESLIGNRPSQRQTRSKKGARSQGDGDRNQSQVLLNNIQNASKKQLSDLVQKAISLQHSLDFQITAAKMVEMLVNQSRSDPKFYPQSLLSDLIRTGKLSYSLCPDLMALCLEKTDVQLLQMCLQQFIDIPESFICSCLKTFLSASEDVLQVATLDTSAAQNYIRVDDASTVLEEPEEPPPVVQNGYSPKATEEDSSDVQMFEKVPQKPTTWGCPVSLKRAVLLNTVLTTPYSETYLLPQLKDLTSDQVVLFLTYLLYLYKLCSEQVALNLPGEEKLSATQIIDWMNLLLDANFTVLVMMPTAKPLLYRLQKTIRAQMKLLSELNKLEGSLLELVKLRRQNKDLGRYSIEVLELY